MAAFIRGFDRATLAIDTKTPEDPAAVRILLADRIRQGWNYRRFEDEKTFSSEYHAGDALTAIFYQRSSFANDGRPSIPSNWGGLEATIPTLTSLVTGAASSGYLSVLFLNLVASSPRAALLSYIVQAMTAWCSAYGADTNFWSEHPARLGAIDQESDGDGRDRKQEEERRAEQAELLRLELQLGHDRHAGETDHDLVREIHQHEEKQQERDPPGTFGSRWRGHGRSLPSLFRFIVLLTGVPTLLGADSITS